jgi:8-oxo-dGTP pyrophosphatase MutT (NUDIX family)
LITQFGALPFRIDEEEGLQILLVTSRDTGRWVVPKGHPMVGRKGHEAAAEEAFEEAGVRGEIAETPTGAFRYPKRRRLLPDVTAEVQVFPLRVDHVLDEWPEAHQRRRQWFSRDEAAKAVAESELKRLILAFAP